MSDSRLAKSASARLSDRLPRKSRDSDKRKNLAIQILNGVRPIIDRLGGIFDVPSQTEGGKYYAVNLNRETCECPDWRKRHRPCKHIWAAKMYRAKIEPNASGEFPSHSNPYKNPKYYDRLRRVRKPCVRVILRCVGEAVNRG